MTIEVWNSKGRTGLSMTDLEHICDYKWLTDKVTINLLYYFLKIFISRLLISTYLY